ncbi:hypothetical protein SASPL_140070 [Salvia splendens]|uniref:Uncharacterized protein n=1 Tax=Salvia splendens TaxID=180675 RepID=A0A8X8WP39_SALSN|nr:hypothetical protein SASPL_140070 [Salvia splendens]
MDTKQSDVRLRVLMFPWLAHGHVFPFLELAKGLANKHFHVYCSTAIILDSIRNNLNNNNDDSSIELLELPLPSLPDLPPHYQEHPTPSHAHPLQGFPDVSPRLLRHHRQPQTRLAYLRRVEVARDEEGGLDGNGVAEVVKEVLVEERLRSRARQMSEKMKMEGDEAFGEIAQELINICARK